jgi:hypothetical protein
MVRSTVKNGEEYSKNGEEYSKNGEEYSKNPVAKLSAVCTMKPRVQLRTVDTLLHCSSQRPRFGIICDFDA